MTPHPYAALFPEMSAPELQSLQRGMELRDWFAGQVLPKLAFPLRNNDDIRNAQELAKDCYRYADAMLEARKKPLP
jgi:hypothetical protein